MSNYQLSLIMLACISIISVSGVFAMTSLAGMFSLGQASYMSICAYLTFCLAKFMNLPIIVTAILGVISCGLVALIVSLPTLKLRRDYFALMTVAFGQMVSSIVILLGTKYSVYPSLGPSMMIKGFIASVIGGLGSLGGAISAAIILGVVEIFLTYWIGSLASPIVLFGGMLLFLAIRPEGLAGRFAKDKV